MSHQWVTIQAITPKQDRLARMAQLRRERNNRGDTTPYRHWDGTVQAYKRTNQTDILKKGGGILADTQHEERTGPR